MNRFFGMMPSSEIEIEKHYKDERGEKVTIQAGLHGWTIIYMDNSSEFEDIDDTADNNFETAYTLATKRLGTLTEMKPRGER
jgi:hypothetical protein